MSNSKSLSWNDRFALIDHFNLSDDQVVNTMGVSQDQLETARDLRSSGHFTPTPNLDVNSYAKMFGVTAIKPTAKTPTATSVTKPTPNSATPAAQTASKPVRVPKKRGRKGDKISKAFSAIPTTAVPAEQFATDNNVSLAVLRQSKRFDTHPQLGPVHVKKDRKTKTLMIWREDPNS